jgi:hypothetical protein
MELFPSWRFHLHNKLSTKLYVALTDKKTQVAIAVVVSAGIYLIFGKRRDTTRPGKQIPAVKRIPILGNVLDFTQGVPAIGEALLRYSLQYPNDDFVDFSVGPVTVTVINSIEAMRALYIEKDAENTKFEFMLPAAERFLVRVRIISVSKLNYCSHCL